MLSITEARDFLRVDGAENDIVIGALLDAIPDYIEITTGMKAEAQEGEPLADTAAKFILQLWYDTERSQSERLQRTIDSLLKALTVKARSGQ